MLWASVLGLTCCMKLDKWEGIQFVKSAWLIFHLDLKVHFLPPIKGDKKGRTWCHWWNWSTWWTLKIFLSQMTLLRWLTFLRGSQTVILIVLLFWTYFFLLMLVFVLQWLSLHWEILIILLSQFPFTSHQSHNGLPISLHSLWLFSCWLRWSSWSFERCSMGVYL